MEAYGDAGCCVPTNSSEPGYVPTGCPRAAKYDAAQRLGQAWSAATVSTRVRTALTEFAKAALFVVEGDLDDALDPARRR